MKQALLLTLTLTFACAAWAQNPQREMKVTPAGAEMKDTETQIFTVVEQQPEFPGGMEALYQFIAANIKWPESDADHNCQGKVYVTFVITKEGHVSNPKVIRDPCPEKGFGEEAIRVVKLMPKWNPGLQRGKPVNVQYNLPINFSLK